MRTLLLTFLLLSAVGCMSAQIEGNDNAFPQFALHHIDSIGYNIGQTALVDMDNDGDLDWVAGEANHSDSRIWWWENRSTDDWIRHYIGRGNTDVGGALHDVDGDGDLDMLSGSVLLLNLGSSEPFEPHDVGTIPSHDTEFADIDGDGVVDALANSDKAGLYWYEIPDNPTQEWRAHLIATAEDHEVHGGVSPRAVGDIDGDGDPDIVTAQGWYENVNGEGLTWTFHRSLALGEPHRYGIAVRTWVVDLDGDGDVDIVQTEADNPDGRVAWFENDGRGTFTRHMIQDEGEQLDFHSLVVADFDHDGDLDVFSCGGPLSADDRYHNIVWENDSGAWTKHVVADQPCHEAQGGDVDGDGDVDIVAKPWSNGDKHYVLRNLAMEERRVARTKTADPGK